MNLTDHAKSVLDSSSPFLLECEETDRYPAAVLPWGTVTICSYSLTLESARILLSATNRLFDWLEPDLPNDLCFLKGDEPWLITMASDRVALLALEQEEMDSLCRRIPGLRLKPVDPGYGMERA
jgi:hypothetical protein